MAATKWIQKSTETLSANLKRNPLNLIGRNFIRQWPKTHCQPKQRAHQGEKEKVLSWPSKSPGLNGAGSPFPEPSAPSKRPFLLRYSKAIWRYPRPDQKLKIFCQVICIFNSFLDPFHYHMVILYVNRARPSHRQPWRKEKTFCSQLPHDVWIKKKGFQMGYKGITNRTLAEVLLYRKLTGNGHVLSK